MSKSVLIVDDEEAISWSLRRALDREGYSAVAFATAEDGLDFARDQPPDAVVLDIRLPRMDGLTAIARFREGNPQLPVIVMTAYGNLDTAVRAVAAGAADYLLKPFDLQTAIDAVARATARPTPARDDGSENVSTTDDEIVGSSAPIQEVFKRIAVAANRSCCVLITGESGTGKELVAKALHRHSPRHASPFLPVHVAGLNPNLVESELFGHARGAYTGATGSRDGLFMLANGGTVLLDEIGEIPLPIQVKLLRALEHDEIWPVGGIQPLQLDLRLLAATHRDLAQLVAEGRFREDLYFRLNVFTIHLPPLRERHEDIPALAEHFLRRIAPHHLPLASATRDFLCEQLWPGNVRELRNALEHASIIARHAALLPSHFPAPTIPHPVEASSTQLSDAIRNWTRERLRADAPADVYSELLKTAEPAMLDEVMQRVRGNRWEASRILGLNRATVRKKLGEHGLDDAHRNSAE